MSCTFKSGDTANRSTTVDEKKHTLNTILNALFGHFQYANTECELSPPLVMSCNMRYTEGRHKGGKANQRLVLQVTMLI